MEIKKFLKDARFRNRVLHNFEMRHNSVRMFSKPVYLELEVTNRCNLKCVMCARPYYDGSCNQPGDMEMETFEKVAPLLNTAEYVYLFGYGEPLLAKNFWNILNRCSELGTYPIIYTNGVKINEEIAERLITGGLGSLTVSLDAAKEETFKAIRNFSLGKIIDNVSLITKKKEELGRPNPRLGLSFVILKENMRELPEMPDIARKIGASTLCVSHAMLYSKQMEEHSAFYHLSELKEIFEETEKRAKERGIELILPVIDGRTVSCRQPFEMLFINWDGKVRPCCSAAFVAENLNIIIGNLNKEKISKIWNGDFILKTREGLLGKGELLQPCVNCGFRVKDIESHRRYLD